MKSIRTRLLAWLLSAVLLGAVLSAAVTYHNVLHELEGQFDYQLRQMALSLRDQGFVSNEDAAAIADEQMDFIVQIWSIDGVRIYSSRSPTSFPPRAILGFSELDAGGTAWRVYSVAARDRVIQVGQPVSVRQDLAARAALRSVAPVFGVAPLLAGLIWWTVGISLAPLQRAAAEVQKRDVNALQPLAEGAVPIEIAPLMKAINALMDRLRASFSAQRAFVADAAHELRSPLTALKLQLGLLDRATGEAERGAARQALSEGIDRAVRLVEQLLTLARNEPGATTCTHGPIDIVETSRLAIADVVALGADRAVEISLNAPATFSVNGNASALRILVRNLVDNAVRYTPRGGRVQVDLHSENSAAVLRVDDNGPGVPVAERERVFNRFYRRNLGDDPDGDSGSGLGLAIVRTIADQHGASVSLLDSPLGGLRAEVRFARAT